MIGNGHRLATLVAANALTLGVLTAVLALPAQASWHTPRAAAAAPAVPADPAITVTLSRDGVASTLSTHAKTVGALLTEQGIAASPVDHIFPSADAPLADGARVEYRAAVNVTLFVGGERHDVVTAAEDVATLLADQGVKLGNRDRVDPAPEQPLEANAVVRVTHETAWTALRKQFLPAGVLHRYSATLPTGTTKTLYPGKPGERDVTVHFVQRDDRPMQAQLIASRIVRQPRARIIVHGIGEYAAFARMAIRGFDATVGLARDALHMIATAYTAGCYGCSGYAANGMRAGHGVVAVDPRLIPLGSRLFIPGYGSAIAGDTGGAIVGHRIDLGFNSLMDALRFGRRAITVYILR